MSTFHFQTLCTSKTVKKKKKWNKNGTTSGTSRHTDLIDERHGVHQQLGIHAVLLVQDLHDVGPQLGACSRKRSTIDSPVQKICFHLAAPLRWGGLGRNQTDNCLVISYFWTVGGRGGWVGLIKSWCRSCRGSRSASSGR